MTTSLDTHFMRESIRMAREAGSRDEVPVGAVIVHQSKIIAKACNQVELLKDPTAHAEMIAITQATSALSSKWLLACTMYVTIEPCCMCAGALVLARIKRLVFGAPDAKAGACGSVEDIVRNKRLNHRLSVKQGVLQDECSGLISEFFRRKRMLKAIMSN